jgi:hypothetical protein
MFHRMAGRGSAAGLFWTSRKRRHCTSKSVRSRPSNEMPTVDFRALRTQHTRSSRVVILNNVSNLRLLEIVTALARLAESQRCAVQLVGLGPLIFNLRV